MGPDLDQEEAGADGYQDSRSPALTRAARRGPPPGKPTADQEEAGADGCQDSRGPALKRAVRRGPPPGEPAAAFAEAYKAHAVRLGRGTFGEVWQASCRKTGQQFAAKFVLQGGYGEDAASLFTREVAIFKQLPRHPNVVQMVDVFMGTFDPDNADPEQLLCVIVMELCVHSLQREWNRWQCHAPDSASQTRTQRLVVVVVCSLL